MKDIQPQEPRGFVIRFVFKSNIEGLGTIVLAILYYRRRKLWLDTAFLPLDLEETSQQFREAFRIVFPDTTPPSFPKAITKPIGAR